MSGEVCHGSGKAWSEDDAWFACAVCGMPRQEANAVDVVPPHTVDAATGEVWVQVAPPKPPEPDPWAVALRTAWTVAGGGVADALPPGTTSWRMWHAAAAEARRLAATDPAIRANHWREVADYLVATGFSTIVQSVRRRADLIESDEER